jgi:replicative DNA helicase
MTPADLDEAIEARVLPHNLQAERAVLGAGLSFRECLDAVIPLVTAVDFFRDAHQCIFSTMIALHEQHIAPDLLTVCEKLQTTGQLDAIGGPTYLASLTDGIPRSSNVEHYAQIVREKAQLRRLIFAANTVLAQAYDAQDAPADILDAAQREFARVADRQIVGGFVSASTLMAEAMTALQTAIDRRRGDEDRISGVPTGFTALDEMLGGLQPGELTLIAARPAMGKTSLEMQIAVQAAAAGYPVGIFSVEMARSALGVRLLAGEARINTLRIRDGRIGDHESPVISAAMNRLAGLPFHIDDSADLSLQDLRAKARRLKVEHQAALIMVDYLQLMKTERAENRNLEVAALSRGLKVLAVISSFQWSCYRSSRATSKNAPTIGRNCRTFAIRAR